MGLGFLATCLGGCLQNIGQPFGHFLSAVWDTNGDGRQIDKGAKQFTDALAQLIVSVLEALVAYAVKNGTEEAL